MQLVMVNPISLVKVCPIKNLHSTDSVSLSYILISLVIWVKTYIKGAYSIGIRGNKKYFAIYKILAICICDKFYVEKLKTLCN